MIQFLKIIGISLLVIFVLLLVTPWIVNVFSIEFVADTYEAYVEWVTGLFGNT